MSSKLPAPPHPVQLRLISPQRSTMVTEPSLQLPSHLRNPLSAHILPQVWLTHSQMDSPTSLVHVPPAILTLTSTILHGAPERSAILRTAISTNSFPSASHTMTALSPAWPLDLAILNPHSRTCTSRHAVAATRLFGIHPWLASEHLAMWPQPRL